MGARRLPGDTGLPDLPGPPPAGGRGEARQESGPATAADRAVIRERLSTRFPRWVIWHDGREWHARRRGSFREAGGAAYHVAAADLHCFRANLAAEDASPVGAQEWDLA